MTVRRATREDMTTGRWVRLDFGASGRIVDTRGDAVIVETGGDEVDDPERVEIPIAVICVVGNSLAVIRNRLPGVDADFDPADAKWEDE